MSVAPNRGTPGSWIFFDFSTPGQRPEQPAVVRPKKKRGGGGANSAISKGERWSTSCYDGLACVQRAKLLLYIGKKKANTAQNNEIEKANVRVMCSQENSPFNRHRSPQSSPPYPTPKKASRLAPRQRIPRVPSHVWRREAVWILVQRSPFHS